MALNPDLHRVTADAIIFDITAHTVLLIKRKYEPFKDSWALPGGHVDKGERVSYAASRELEEETGLQVNPEALEFVGLFDDPDADPRGPVLRLVYAGTVVNKPETRAGDDAAETTWINVMDVISGNVPIAFDHRKMISKAVIIL